MANSVQIALDNYAEVTIWSQGVFEPGATYIQALAEAADRFDFALLIMGADDVVESRGSTKSAPRDNVIFELGLFIGALGRNRTFFMYNRDHTLKFRPIFPASQPLPTGAGLTETRTRQLRPPVSGSPKFYSGWAQESAHSWNSH